VKADASLRGWADIIKKILDENGEVSTHPFLRNKGLCLVVPCWEPVFTLNYTVLIMV